MTTILRLIILIFLLFIWIKDACADVDAGLAAFNEGNKAQAIELLKRSPDHPVAQIMLARIYIDSDLDEAEKWVERALKGSQEDAEVHYTLAQIKGLQAQSAIFSKLSLARQSKKAFEKAVELEPDSVKYLQGLLTYHLSAPSLAGGSMDKAQELAERIKERDPVQGVLAMVSVATANDDDEQKAELFENALTNSPENPLIAFNAGLYFQQKNDYQRAFKLFTTAANNTSDEFVIPKFASFYQIGRTAVFSQSNVKEGIRALVDYLENAPDDPDLVAKPWARYRLAILLELDNRVDEASRIFKSLEDADDERLRQEVKKRT